MTVFSDAVPEHMETSAALLQVMSPAGCSQPSLTGATKKALSPMLLSLLTLL